MNEWYRRITQIPEPPLEPPEDDFEWTELPLWDEDIIMDSYCPMDEED